MTTAIETLPGERKTVVAVLDIDGTLLDSSDAHQQAVSKAMAAFLVDPYSRPLSAFRHFTDSGVLDELLVEKRGRGVSPDELSRFEEDLTRHFEALAGKGLNEIAGASVLLAELLQHETILPVFATGSSRGAAEIKLRSLGIDPAAVILKTGSDYIRREDIIEATLKDAVTRLGEDVAISAVSIGDGVWDERTAHALDIPFIGVGGDPERFMLRVERTVRDLSELTAACIAAIARPFRWKGGGDVTGP